MASLTLEPFGEDWSVIKHHSPDWCFFGMTPKLLRCSSGKESALKGPAMFPAADSFVRYNHQ